MFPRSMIALTTLGIRSACIISGYRMLAASGVHDSSSTKQDLDSKLVLVAP
jgi:hypothetical protein